MTLDDADKILLLIESAWPNWKPKPQTVLLWRALLTRFEARIVERAVMEFVVSPRPFAPAIGELIDSVFRLAMGAITAEEAWSEVQRAIEKVGYYGSPVFQHPAIAQAVAALGWRTICTSENVEATRAHFFREFNAYQERHLRERRTAFVGEVRALVESSTRALEGMHG